MAVRKGKAEWKGNLKQGAGTLSSETGAVEGAYSFGSRFEEGEGTNPEELIAAAHAACFSMAFANILAGAGYTPDSVVTEASVHLTPGGDGPPISRIELDTVARATGIEEDEFQELAEEAKNGCPVSQALSSVDIRLKARLA